MSKLVNIKAGKLTLTDAMLIALTKQLEERLLAKTFVGNGTLMSGALKLGGAIAVNKLASGKIADIGATALMIDATEDIAVNLIGMSGLGSNNGSSVGTI